MVATECYIEDWVSAVCESDKTVALYRTNITVFSEFCLNRWGRDFSVVVEEWRKAKRTSLNEREGFLELWSDIVRNFNTYILKQEYAPLTIKNFLSTVKSFFKFWNIPLYVRLPRRACVIYHNRDLTRDEVKQILAFASPRDRVIWLVMAESGMRVSTAIHMKYWQIREDFEAERVPMRILLPSESLKDHVGDRWTFIGEDGYRALRNYLSKRLPLQDNDLVFVSEKEGKVKGETFSVSSLSTKFSRLVTKLGLCETRGGHPKAIRQHSLRKFFRNNMRTDSAYREFWMGHSLGTDSHYISRDFEEHRQLYQAGYDHLRIFEPVGTEHIVKEQALRIAKLENEVKEWQKVAERFKRILDEEQREWARTRTMFSNLSKEMDRLKDAIEEKTKERRLRKP